MKLNLAAEYNMSSFDTNTFATGFSFVPANTKFEDIVNKGVALHFWNDMGSSFMGQCGPLCPPLLKSHADKDATFCIVWVDAHASKVAIKSMKNEDTLYISCGMKNFITNSALASFSSCIGPEETFTVRKVNNSYLFQSHNHLFLHYNETFHSVAFKACSDRDENGYPIKGRWTLLLENQTNWVGTKNGSTQICYKVASGSAKVAARIVVNGLKVMSGDTSFS